MQDGFRTPSKSPLVKEYVDIIKRIPEDEGVLLFVFKTRKVDFRKILEDRLTAAGVDVNATVLVNNTMKPRFAWLTHGNETSLSKYSYCRNEVWVGVLHKPRLAVHGEILGQRDDINSPVSRSFTESVYKTEIAYCLHQGFARCACRIVKGGVARPPRFG